MGPPQQCQIIIFKEMSADCLRKRRSLNVDSTILSMYAECFDIFILCVDSGTSDRKTRIICSALQTSASNNPLSLFCTKSRYCVKPVKSLMTIHIFYITSTYFCPRPEQSEPSHIKQTGSVINLFQCLYDFSATSTSGVSVRDTSIIMCVCCVLFV